MKKYLGLIALTATLASCSVATLPSTADLSGIDSKSLSSNVELYRAWSITTSHYGIVQIDRGVDILVKDLAYGKQVWVHQQMKDGSWKDFPASFVKKAGSGLELWTASLCFNAAYQASYDLADAFCVKYAVGGSTYWDNNGGANYSLASDAGYLLGKDAPIVSRYASLQTFSNQPGMAYFSGAADLRNLAYAKDVKLFYSADGWASKNCIALGYNSSYSPSYGKIIPSPNAAGVEFWSWGASIPCSSSIQYYLAYTVNGTTYYDNAFGANHAVAYPAY